MVAREIKGQMSRKSLVRWVLCEQVRDILGLTYRMIKDSVLNEREGLMPRPELSTAFVAFGVLLFLGLTRCL